jgi:hypothetical protein
MTRPGGGEGEGDTEGAGEGPAIGVPQERVLGRPAGEEVGVEADEEDGSERETARLHRVEHPHTAVVVGRGPGFAADGADRDR